MIEYGEPHINSLPIIGTNPFGLTEQHVSEAVAALTTEQTEKSTALEDADEKTRGYIARRMPVCERQLNALKTSSEDVLRYTKSVYDKISELGKLPEAEIVSRIRTEFPNVLDYYPLLRKKPWGYVLGQKITHAKSLES